MKVFLAATSDKSFISNITDSKYILESFYYFQEWQIPLIKKSEMFLLDSGAFTFMSGKKSNDFDGYLTRYIDFIKKHDVKHFFELDIDSIVGYDKVKQLRKRLEKETGKKCIPVWHKSRGKEEFLKMCDEYNYVAIGGIVTKEITKDQYPFLLIFWERHTKEVARFTDLVLQVLQTCRNITLIVLIAPRGNRVGVSDSCSYTQTAR